MPITIVEAIRGATVEVPTLVGQQAHPRARRAPSTARSSACAARARRSSAARAAATSTTACTIDVPRSLSREQQKAIDELAQVMDGNPRERLFAGEG